MPDAKIGQVWQDNDPRSYGRRIRVERVDDRYAYGHEVQAPGVYHPGKPRPFRILLTSFKIRPARTGYRLVQEAPDARP